MQTIVPRSPGRRRLTRRSLAVLLLATFGCVAMEEGPGEEPAAAPGVAPETAPGVEDERATLAPTFDSAQQGEVQLHFLYVHGVKGCPDHRRNAENSLNELEAAMNAALPSWIAAYEASHPGVTIVTSSAHANVYTATPSPYHPSDSTDPLNMDDWEVGDPGCATTRQGEPCTTAFEWRYRLAQEIHAHFPADAQNIFLIGHSTGARAAFEVAANVGPDGVGTYDWGVQDKIAGVITVQGMVDSLGTSKYDVAGPASFESSCKYGDPIVGFGDGCAPGNGWCEYAGDISAFDAADWVAQNKHALMLISYASCSPSAFAGFTDGSLPFDAQGSPLAVGTEMTAAPGKTYRPAHGVKYGSFCHSAIVDPGKDGHAQAVESARSHILDWLFTSASRVAGAGMIDVDPIAYGRSTSTFDVGSTCPAGTDGGMRVAGRCRHPGYFDGDDHVIAASELTIDDGPSCNGAFSWTQAHDKNNDHAATFWWKTYALPTGAGVVHGLP